MKFHLAALLILIPLLGACDRGEPQTVDPMGETKGLTAVPRTLTCVATSSSGECLKKTCRKDDQGDCATYAGYCVNAGEHWNGTSDGGACTKVL